VEFALILPILVFLVLGALDLGHRYYIQHLITNASREGARYAGKYTGTAAAPTETQVSNYIKLPAPGLNYNGFNLSNLTIAAVYTGAFPNRNVTVTVTADKHWWVLGAFTLFGFPGITNPQTLTGTTVMNVEH
jgi:Flp pilus assembly protein TadG